MKEIIFPLGVNTVYWWIFGGSLVLLTGVTAVMVLAALKKNRCIPSGRGNGVLEITWIAVPSFIAFTLMIVVWTSR